MGEMDCQEKISEKTCEVPESNVQNTPIFCIDHHAVEKSLKNHWIIPCMTP